MVNAKLGVIRILQIIPAGESWCARFATRDENKDIREQWWCKVAVWALCEDLDGDAFVMGMDEGDCGVLQFCADTDNFINYEYIGLVPKPD
jgi:hypothetical protein